MTFLLFPPKSHRAAPALSHLSLWLFLFPAGGAELARAPFDAAAARAHQTEWAAQLGTQIESTNAIGMTMMLIPPGEFLMGSTDAQVEEALAMAEVVERIPPELRQPLAEGRLLILSCFPESERRLTAELAARRNEFAAALADEVWLAHIIPGGQAERLTRILTGWRVPVSMLEKS